MRRFGDLPLLRAVTRNCFFLIRSHTLSPSHKPELASCLSPAALPRTHRALPPTAGKPPILAVLLAGPGIAP
jgi:hypothetical protein